MLLRNLRPTQPLLFVKTEKSVHKLQSLKREFTRVNGEAPLTLVNFFLEMIEGTFVVPEDVLASDELKIHST